MMRRFSILLTVLPTAFPGSTGLLCQGMLKGVWCLDPEEVLWEGQAEEITRVHDTCPAFHDDDFTGAHLAGWFADQEDLHMQLRAQKTRSKILKTARRLFAEKGFTATVWILLRKKPKPINSVSLCLFRQ